MKIILREEVKGLGTVGETLQVKDGYARNYLIPQGVAVFATEKNLRMLEKERAVAAKKQQEAKESARLFADELSKVSVTISAEAKEDDKIFGSIGIADIAAALKSEGFEIAKKDIVLEEPLKELGAFDVQISVHPEVFAKIKVWVVRKG